MCHIAVHDKLTASWSLLPGNLHECSGNIATATAGPIPAYLLLFPPVCSHSYLFAPVPKDCDMQLTRPGMLC